jgi:hypothetical protein
MEELWMDGWMDGWMDLVFFQGIECRGLWFNAHLPNSLFLLLSHKVFVTFHHVHVCEVIMTGI